MILPVVLVASAACSLLFSESVTSLEPAEPCLGNQRSYSRGRSTGPESFEHIDYRQGTLTMWLRPLRLPSEANAVVPLLSLGGIELRATYPSGLEADVLGLDTYAVATPPWTVEEDTFVSLRWDSGNSLSGDAGLGSHLELRVGQREFFLQEDDFVPAFATDAELAIGSGDGSIHVDQLVIYDRPLFVDDDVNVPSALFDMAEDKSDNPRLVNGGFSALFATASPSLGGCDAYAADGWTRALSLTDDDFSQGDASGWAGIVNPSIEPVFRGGGVSLDVGEELTTTLQVEPNGSYVIDVLSHGSGPGTAFIVVRSEVGGDILAGMQGRDGSTRENPERLVLTFDVPSTVRSVEVILAANTAAVEFHKFSLRANLLEGTAFEGGALDEDIWRRDSAAEPPILLLGDDPYASLTSACIESVSAPEVLMQEPAGLVDDEFYLFGSALYWFDGQAPGVTIGNGSFFATGAPYDRTSKAGAIADRQMAWRVVGAVGRRFRSRDLNSQNDLIRFGATSYNPDDATRFCLDSAYTISARRIDGRFVTPP